MPLIPLLLLPLIGLLMAGAWWRWRDVRPVWGIGGLGWIAVSGFWLASLPRLPWSRVVMFWRLGDMERVALALRMDALGWRAVVALSGLALAAWLQAALDVPERWWRWFLWLGLVVAACLSALAANGITLLLAWAAFDALDFVLTLSGLEPESAAQSDVLRALALRAGTVFLLLWGGLQSGGLGNPLAFATLPDMLARIVALAVGIRWCLAPFPSSPRERGTAVLRQAGLWFSGGVVLARTAGLHWPPAWSAIAWLVAALALAGLWGFPRAIRWSDGWFVALGGMVWALLPWWTPVQALAAMVLAGLGGALLAWWDVHGREVNVLGAIVAGLGLAFAWLPPPLWRQAPGVAGVGLLFLAALAVVAWRRWRAAPDPFPAGRLERALWWGSLTLLVLAMGGLTAPVLGRGLWPVAPLVLAAGTLGIVLDERWQSRRERSRWWEWLVTMRPGSRLWGWMAQGGQRLIRAGLGLLEGRGGLLWSLLLLLILLSAWEGR